MIRLGTCIAPVGPQKSGRPILKYEFLLPDGKKEGVLHAGEMKLISLPYKSIDAIFIPEKGLDLGAGPSEMVEKQIYGGEVGVILDGRGRKPFNILVDQKDRISKLIEWAKETNEFPRIPLN